MKSNTCRTICRHKNNTQRSHLADGSETVKEDSEQN